MTSRQRITAWVLLLVTVALAITGWVAFWLTLALGRDSSAAWGAPGVFGVWAIGFAAPGFILARRLPRNPVGWLLLWAGVFASIMVAAAEWTTYGHTTGGGEPRIVILGFFGWIAAVGLLQLAILMFPSGRPLAGVWRAFFWANAGLTVVFALVTFGLTVSWYVGDSSVQELLDADSDPFSGLLFVLLQLATVGTLVAVVVRFRRSVGVERQQMRWLTWSVGVIAGFAVSVELVLANVVDGSPVYEAGTWIFSLAPVLVPISLGVAVLKYRLYDLDLVIKRTLVYGPVVVVLLGAYALGVFILGGLLPVEGDLAVAASTLAVAALFNPLRKRAQALVERTFYRSSYDAQKVVDEFSQRLAGEIDLEALTDDWLATVDQAVKPKTASVWVREQ